MLLIGTAILILASGIQGVAGSQVATAEPTGEATLAGTPAGTAVPLSLRSAADARGFLVGAAVDVNLLSNDKTYTDTLAREFNLVVPENAMKFDATQPSQTTFSFTGGDKLVKFAEAHSMKIRGHNLVWHNQLPGWLTKGTFTKDQLLAILKDHVTTVVKHFKGHVYAWDVVNEAVDDNTKMRDSIWMKTIGPEYIKDAFEWAHEADPDAILYYNDYNGEGMGGKSDAIYAMVKDLVDQGVPINGVGLQMHVSIVNYPKPDALAVNMARYEKLGLQIQITEMDVKVDQGVGGADERFAAQAQVYKDVLTTCLQAKNCNALLTWGFTDAHTWIDDSKHAVHGPLPFDNDYKPKPAYQALLDTLQNTQ